MIPKVVVRGPALTRSGYGEHTRFLLRSLRKRESEYDIYVLPVNWGQTGWMYEDDEERRWLDHIVRKTHMYTDAGGKFDMSIQVTIPNEWEKLAPYNIGVTAGIETTKVAPVWLHKANMMDKIITISEHSKNSYQNTIYEEIEGRPRLECKTPIHIVHYPVKTIEPSELELNLDYNFNYLVMAQWGPRKNIENTVRWWVEENFDQKVGLVLKVSSKNNSIMDREHVYRNLKNMIKSVKQEDMKCKIYLLHGDLTDNQMQALYNDPKIKCLVSLTHGEGFGLPIFDAACNGLPIIAPGWSGHCDFLYMPDSKGKNKSMFADVNYDLAPIHKGAKWDGVLEKDSSWCYAHEGHYKMRLRQVRKNYSKWKKKAEKLKDWVLEEFNSDKQHALFADTVGSPYDEVKKMFDEVMGSS